MTEFISDDDMTNTVQMILQTFPDDIEGFRQASQIYESTFFEGENPEFIKRLATGLKAKFKPYSNALWNKLAGE